MNGNITPYFLPSPADISRGNLLDLIDTFDRLTARVKAIGDVLTDLEDGPTTVRTLGDVLYGMAREAEQFSQLWTEGSRKAAAVTADLASPLSGADA